MIPFTSIHKYFIGTILAGLSMPQHILAEEPIATGSLTISPSAPNKSWTAPRALYPDESVSLNVTVESEGEVKGNTFTIEGSPQVSFSSSGTLWSQTSGGEGDSFSFKALNTGLSPKQETVTVKAVWTGSLPATGTGGSGSGSGITRIFGAAQDANVPPFFGALARAFSLQIINL